MVDGASTSPPSACSAGATGRAAAAASARRWTCRRASTAGSPQAPTARVRLGRAQGDLPPQPRRSRRAALLAAGRRRQEPAGGRAAVVHDDVRPRQHLHQPAGAAVHAGAGRRRPCARSGEWQGTRIDDFRDEDPGRILHEMRYGEMTAFEERPHSPVLRRRRRDARCTWSCSTSTSAGPATRSSCATSRSRRAPRSTGSTSTPTCRATATSGTSAATSRPGSRTSAGRTPGTRSPIATAACPASRARRASCRATPTTPRCARRGWRATSGRTRRYADRLEREAADLKRRFNRDFWVEDGEYFALALDTEGKQVDALTSNIGHLLWSGIVDKSKAKAVARHLVGPRLFSGWGVRTLAEGEARYNPIGYHVGTVWPFDNSFIAWGLRRYGFKDEAALIAAGILDAAEFFDGRLPEAFGGYERDADELPGGVPDRLQPAGVVDGRAAALPAHDARPRADRRPPDRRPGAPRGHRAGRAARHPRPLGPHRRLRARARTQAKTPPAPADADDEARPAPPAGHTQRAAAHRRAASPDEGDHVLERVRSDA